MPAARQSTSHRTDNYQPYTLPNTSNQIRALSRTNSCLAILQKLHIQNFFEYITVGIAKELKAAVPDVQVVGGMSHPGKLKVADGRVLAVEKKTCPVRIALHTSWGLVTLDLFCFAIIPGDQDVVILGNPTMKLLRIVVYDSFAGARTGTRGPHRCRHRGVPAVSPSHRQVSTLCSSNRA